MSTIRKMAVAQGRAMIRVRDRKTKELKTIGVCPGCWNVKERREILFIQLKKMNLETVHSEDTLNGVYRISKEHAPGCRFSHISGDPWKNFSTALKK